MPSSLQRWLTGAYGLACAIGLVGAFVGLSVSSFSLDELFTAWVVSGQGGFGGALGRMLTDVHPPAYYALIYGHARIFGASESALRLFSAVCACAAILTFVIGARGWFSLPARLFAAAIATSSQFWYAQSQNARDYSLSLWIGAALLVLSLQVLRAGSDARRTRTLLLAMGPLMLLGAFVHFYVLYECLAILIVLGLLLPGQRRAAGGLALGLLGLAVAYLVFVIQPYTQYSTTDVWIRGDARWIVEQMIKAAQRTLGKPGAVAIAICCGLALVGLAPAIRARRSPGGGGMRGLLEVVRRDPALALCVLAPIILAAGAVASSVLVTPNITARNLLVCSPLLWGLFARLFDIAMGGARLPAAVGANLAIAAALLWGSTIAFNRDLPRNEDFRGAANWIASAPACRGQRIPVVVTSSPEQRKGDFALKMGTQEYGHYLGARAVPWPVYRVDVETLQASPELRAELAARLVGTGCPVLAWVAHGMRSEDMPKLSGALAGIAGVPGAQAKVRVKGFRPYDSSLRAPLLPPSGFVIYVDRSRLAEAADRQAIRSPG